MKDIEEIKKYLKEQIKPRKIELSVEDCETIIEALKKENMFWELDERHGDYVCSECKYYTSEHLNYCPNCGRKNSDYKGE